MADNNNEPTKERLSLEQDLIELLKRRQGIEEDTLNDARDLANVLRNQTQALTFQITEKSRLRSISKEINKIAEQSYTRDKSVVGTSKDLNDLAKNKLALEEKIKNLSSFQNQILTDDKKLQEDINQSIKDQISNAQKLKKEIEDLQEESEKVANNFGVKTFGALEDISKSIPGLRTLSKPFSDAANASRTVAQSGASGAKALMAGGKSLVSSLGKALGPVAIIVELVEAFLKLDQSAGETAKSMGVSYSTATQLNSQFNSMANNSGNIFVTTKGINESFNQINAALGTNAELSADILVAQTELVKQAGYSVEAATMLSKLSIATGKPTKEIASNFLGQVKALNLVNGTAVNEKQLLEDISSVSKDTLATFASQPGKLAEAAYEARKLGLDLEKLKGTQSALLDIESSIASEFEAEVLTGKQLNLERARYFALTNDYAGLAKELGKQDITRDSFGKMNVLQQEATAKALGMSAETMGGMLMDQEAMSKLSGIDGDNAKEKFNNLVKQVGMEEAKKRLGNETLADQMASASMQDRFAASMEKLKEIFITLVDPLMPVLDVFSSIFNVVGTIMQFLDPMIQTALVGVAAIQDIVNGVKYLLGTLFNGNSDAFKGGSAFVNQIGKAEVSAQKNYGFNIGTTEAGRESRVEDGIAPSSKGPFTITDKFGATAITATGDSLAVSPNIQQTPSIRTPQQATVVQQSQSIDYDKMAQALSKVNVNTNIDGVKVSNQLFNKPAAAMAVRKI
jgi:hypothetical protein